MIKEINGSNIKAVGWDERVLTLYYYDGSEVEYLEVPEGIYAGILTAPSAGSFLRLYVNGNYTYRKIKESDIESKIKQLEHYKATTSGLWATDRLDLIPESAKGMFFRIT